MHVNVDQTRRDIQSGNVDHLQRRGRIQILRHCPNASIFDGYIADGADAVLGIDDVPTLQEQIGCLRLREVGIRPKPRPRLQV